MSNIKIKFLHTPKTGGTAIKSTLVKNYTKHVGVFLKSKIEGLYFCHHSEIHKNDEFQYIFIVRNPIDRFVSHYNYFKYGTKYDTAKYFAGPRLHANLVSQDINDFIMKQDKTKFSKFMSLHKNLKNVVKNVNEHTKNIIMVGTVETLDSDFIKIQKKLKVDNVVPISKTYTNKKPDKIKTDKLTKESKIKLREILSDEYDAIFKLVNLGYLPKSYLKKIDY